jgi:hypothetical protein
MERVRPAAGAGVGLTAALAAVLLAGCSTVVQPKNAAAAVTPTTSASSSASAAPSSATPTPTPTVAGKDVDKTVCPAVRTDIATAKDKAETDKASAKKAGTDLKTLGTQLRTQATKTKVTQLKSTLSTLGTEYQTLGTDTAAGKPTTADEAKIADNGAKLDELCAEKPTS